MRKNGGSMSKGENSSLKIALLAKLGAICISKYIVIVRDLLTNIETTHIQHTYIHESTGSLKYDKGWYNYIVSK